MHLWLLAWFACGTAPPPEPTPTRSVQTEPTSLVGHRDVTAKALHDAKQQGEVQLIDVRSSHEFASGHVAGAINLPIEEFTLQDPRLSGLDKERPVYAICASGGRSSVAVRHLSSGGFEALNVTGGTRQWTELGYPLE